jgi:hypothetical protein
MDIPKEIASLPPAELDWKSEHPLLKAAKSGDGFICFHTQSLIPKDVEQAIDEERSIEIDITQVGPSMGNYQEKRVVMSHTPWMYLAQGKKIPTPKELKSPEGIVDGIANMNVFVKFDIKSPEVIPWVALQAKKIKPSLRMIHAFVSDLHAINIKGEVKAAYIQEKGHSVMEYVSTDQLRQLKSELGGIPIQASCRGITFEDIGLKDGDNYPAVDKLCKTIQGVAEVINFNVLYPQSMPKDKRKLPHDVIKYVWDRYGLMVELNVDAGETAPKGVPFLGRSDSMQNATKVNPLSQAP